MDVIEKPYSQSYDALVTVLKFTRVNDKDILSSFQLPSFTKVVNNRIKT